MLYTQRLIKKSREQFAGSALSGMGGIPESWYPVYAHPANWYEMIQEQSGLTHLELDLQYGEDGKSRFVIIDGNQPLSWEIMDDKDTTMQLNQNAAVKKSLLMSHIKQVLGYLSRLIPISPGLPVEA